MAERRRSRPIASCVVEGEYKSVPGGQVGRGRGIFETPSWWKKKGKMPREFGKHAKHAQIAKIRVSICTRIPPICVGCCTYLVSFGLLCLLWILVGGLEVVLALGVIIIILLHCSSHCFLLSSSSSSLSLSSWLALLLSEK